MKLYTDSSQSYVYLKFDKYPELLVIGKYQKDTNNIIFFSKNDIFFGIENVSPVEMEFRRKIKNPVL